MTNPDPPAEKKPAATGSAREPLASRIRVWLLGLNTARQSPSQSQASRRVPARSAVRFAGLALFSVTVQTVTQESSPPLASDNPSAAQAKMETGSPCPASSITGCSSRDGGRASCGGEITLIAGDDSEIPDVPGLLLVSGLPGASAPADACGVAASPDRRKSAPSKTRSSPFELLNRGLAKRAVTVADTCIGRPDDRARPRSAGLTVGGH